MNAPTIPNQPIFLSWPKPDGVVADRENGIYEFDVWQQGRCAICGNEQLPRGHRVHHMDHDHSTGLVRGRLCSGCNVRESRSSLRAYRMWREGWNPCAMFGWYYAWAQSPRPPHHLGNEGLSAHLEATFIAQAHNKVRRTEWDLRRALSNGS